jgi:hypothetical protein
MSSAPELQADAEGYYLPGYRFTVKGFQFASFNLRPEAWVTFAKISDGIEHPARCAVAMVKPDTLHLGCDYPGLGVVTIDGNFLTRIATSRSDTAVVSAIVTVTAEGQLFYHARDSFIWVLGD